jgi:hypothetical protein
MHPYSTQYLAAERARELREQAAAARQAGAARRARRGPVLLASGRRHARRPSAPRWA